MRFLVLGAGGLGGYFGGRLQEAGQDVTFLVREKRAQQLAQHGLTILSRYGGDTVIAQPVLLTRHEPERLDQLGAPQKHFDVILLGCKAYDLDDAMASIAPFVQAHTMIVPLLNGVAHLEKLAARFGRPQLLGGYCLISAALDEQGRIVHYNDTHKLAFGELDGAHSARVEALRLAFSSARCDAVASPRIVDEMWEKWLLIACGASITCLMRASIGKVIQAGGAKFANRLLDECIAIAVHNGHQPSAATIQKIRDMVLDINSPVTASMYKDIQRGARVEADHLIGDLLARRAPLLDQGAPPQLLDVVSLHLNTYQLLQQN